MKKFIYNCQQTPNRIGPLSTSEIESSERSLIIFVQNVSTLSQSIPLKRDEDQIWRCAGRIPNYNPIFIPKGISLARLIIDHYHKLCIHEGVSSTMCKICERFWIPQLRSLVKKHIWKCGICERYQVQPLPTPPQAMLPLHRIEFIEPFLVVDVDFAGPILYKRTAKETGKALVALFTCCSTCVVHLRLTPDLSAPEFIKTLKEFVARRGKPQLIISDNTRTFTATKKWLKTLVQSHKLNDYLVNQRTEWRFNLARAQWWGGFFERLIVIMKRSLSKAIGRGFLSNVFRARRGAAGRRMHHE